MRYLNAAFYQFTLLENPLEWKRVLKDYLSPHSIKGSILLAKEGINGFLAGPEDDVRGVLAKIKAEAPFQSLEYKESFSESLPFKRLLVKVKPEIVTFRVPELDPKAQKSGRLSPEELRQWYERAEDFVILDTRNQFEYELGAFQGAVSLGLKHFVDFAEAAKALPEDWKKKKVVTYCTGGIRCEKAAPYLTSLGFEEVYQLDGGILRYFEKEHGQYWKGDCFVFDHRVALKPDLTESGAYLCKKCHNALPATQKTCTFC